MKKLWITLLCLCMLCACFVFPVSASDDFTFIMQGPAQAKNGETLNITLTLGNVQPSSGILSADFILEYDAAVFYIEDISLTRKPSEAWQVHFNNKSGENRAVVMLYDNNVDTPAKNDELVLQLTLKVLSVAPANANSVLKIKDIYGSDGNAGLISGAESECRVLVNPQSPLKTPTVTAVSDAAQGGITFQFTDPNPASDVKSYIVTLRRADTHAGLAQQTLQQGFSSGIFVAQQDISPAGQSYYITVTAVGPNNATSEEGKSESVIMPDKFQGLEISAQPKLSYTAGDKLDAKGMSVTLVYLSGKRETVAFADFASKGISLSKADGTALSVSDDKLSITVTYQGITVQTLPVTVLEKACAHTETETETVKATCHADGSETVKCKKCGSVISHSAITERPAHDFLAEELVYTDPKTGSKTYTARCKNCPHEQSRIETPETSEQGGETNPPDTTTAPTGSDDPAVTTTDAPATEPAKTGCGGAGCSSVMQGSAVAMLLAMAGAIVLLRKKK